MFEFMYVCVYMMENNFFIVFDYVLHIYLNASQYDNILFSFASFSRLK